MPPIRLAIFACLLALPVCAVGQTQPDFSGAWKMDASRSESAHQDAPIGPVLLVIRQTPDELQLQTKRTDKRTAAVSTESLTFRLDGTETTDPGTSGTPVKVKAHWDGAHLIAETAREMNGSTVTTRQVFELGDNGRQITIHKSLTVQHGYQGPGTPSSTGSGTDVFVRTGAPAK